MTGKKLFKGINHIITSLLLLALLFALLSVSFSKITKEYPDLLGYQMKTVLSGSMEPEFKTGSVIFIKTKEELSRFQIGDVITFLSEEDMTITHRITEVNVNNGNEQYVTKGDANDGDDLKPVLTENIIGKYTGFTIPYIGYIMSYLLSNLGSFLLVIPGVLLVIHSIFIIRRIARHIDDNNNEVNADSK